MTPEVCPNCGADLPRRARACPQCGADEQTGWSEEARCGGLDLPDEEFDYDAYVKKEFGTEKKIIAHGIRWHWWAAAVGLVALFLFLLLGR